MERKEKEKFVADLRKELADSTCVVVTRQSGLTVSEVTELRTKAREHGTGYKVAKNTLARLAVRGLPCESLADVFSGPCAIAYSKDPIAAAKVMVEFGKNNSKLEVLSGTLDTELLDAEAVKNLAEMPSLDELRGKIIGVISAPATKVAGVLQAPAGQLARVFSARSEQDL